MEPWPAAQLVGFHPGASLQLGTQAPVALPRGPAAVGIRGRGAWCLVPGRPALTLTDRERPAAICLPCPGSPWAGRPLVPADTTPSTLGSSDRRAPTILGSEPTADALMPAPQRPPVAAAASPQATGSLLPPAGSPELVWEPTGPRWLRLRNSQGGGGLCHLNFPNPPPSFVIKSDTCPVPAANQVWAQLILTAP